MQSADCVPCTLQTAYLAPCSLQTAQALRLHATSISRTRATSTSHVLMSVARLSPHPPIKTKPVFVFSIVKVRYMIGLGTLLHNQHNFRLQERYISYQYQNNGKVLLSNHLLIMMIYRRGIITNGIYPYKFKYKF